MSSIRNMPANKGSVTIAVAVLLSAIMILNLVFYDLVSLWAHESRAKAGMLLACESVLSSYDALLAQKYGLYGYNTGYGGSAQDAFTSYYKADDYRVTLRENFTEETVLKRQILGIMKFKTPVNVAGDLLKVCNLLSDAEQKGSQFRLCAEAAELLADLQTAQLDFKRKVEGYFQGDPACVNGYSDAAIQDVFLRIQQETDSSGVSALLNVAATTFQQYLEYNQQAVLLSGELQAEKEKIDAKLDQLRQYGPLSADAAAIQRQAASISNQTAAQKLQNNIQVLTGRVAAIKQLKLGDAIPFEQIKSIFFEQKVECGIRVNLIYPENPGDASAEDRDAVRDKIAEALPVREIQADTYVVPPEEFRTFPSVQISQAHPDLGAYDALHNLGSLDDFQIFFNLLTADIGKTSGELLENLEENVLIDDYILTYMTTRLDLPSQDRLNNETEYILEGSASCAENNQMVEYKILAIRFVLDLIQVLQDPERCAEAEAIARAVAAAISMGAGVPFYKLLILSGFALYDACQDLHRLLRGEAVPLIGIPGETGERLDSLQNYSFYLRILLLMTTESEKLMRICDIIELNMREETHMRYKLSGVYNKISAVCKVRMEFLSPLLLGKRNEEYYREDSCETSYDTVRG